MIFAPSTYHSTSPTLGSGLQTKWNSSVYQWFHRSHVGGFGLGHTRRGLGTGARPRAPAEVHGRCRIAGRSWKLSYVGWADWPPAIRKASLGFRPTAPGT